MKQIEIQNVLHEAASPACTPQRRSEIRELLHQAVSPDGTANGLICNYRLARMVNFLFDSALEHRPDQLPSLFPFFAAACGNRSGTEPLAPIEWSLLHQELETSHSGWQGGIKDIV